MVTKYRLQNTETDVIIGSNIQSSLLIDCLIEKVAAQGQEGTAKMCFRPPLFNTHLFLGGCPYSSPFSKFGWEKEK